MSTERGPSGPHLPEATGGPEGPRSATPKPRNIWRDGLWIGATAFVIITIGALYQTWLHLGPEGKNRRSQLWGDGVNVASYGFDLSKLAAGVNPNEIVATGLRKDEVPVIDEASFITVTENTSFTGHEKYVLPTDRVIGVVQDGAARAYPVQVMQVHQIVNTVERDWPISINYDPNCELALALTNNSMNCVSEFRESFGVSGLVYKGVNLLFDRSWFRLSHQGYPEATKLTDVDKQSLWSPLMHGALSGPASQPYTGEGSDSRGNPIGGVAVLQWRDWVAAHPDTLIVQREEARIEQYKKDLYGPYFLTDKLPYSIAPQLRPIKLAELGLRNKSRGLGFSSGDKRCFVPHEAVLQSASYAEDGLGTWTISLWSNKIEFRCRKADVGFTPSTVWVVNESEPNVSEPHIPLIFLFAWYATHPDTYILQADGSLVKP